MFTNLDGVDVGDTFTIEVFGEVLVYRVIPTPQSDLDAAGSSPDAAGFPWWVVASIVTLLLASVYVWLAGRPSRRLPPGRPGGQALARDAEQAETEGPVTT